MRRTLQTAMLSLDWLVDRGVKVEGDADWQGKRPSHQIMSSLANQQPIKKTRTNPVIPEVPSQHSSTTFQK